MGYHACSAPTRRSRLGNPTTGFASDRVLPGESFSFTFEDPGIFRYVCRHHGLAGMTGTITVT
ncbi:MAG: hypothetical protein H0U38_08640 [Chloroflexia bacterium]|nr:hypothetical protein [Chloroflexia bacterium]